MNLSSESITIKETAPDFGKLFFEKEYVNYNYAPRIMSESVTFILVPLSMEPNKNRLRAAAKALCSDYIENEELTIFTSLDAEDFYEKG